MPAALSFLVFLCCMQKAQPASGINPESLVMEVKENSKENTKVGTIKTKSGTVSKSRIRSDGFVYFIKPDGSEDSSTKVLDFDPGTISLRNATLLDAEKYSSIRTEIEIGYKHNEQYYNLTIMITDENDNAPIFTTKNIIGKVFESAQLGDAVDVTITATDADVDVRNNHIAYHVIDKDVPFKFLDNTKKLVVAGKLDYETKSEYKFAINANNPNADKPQSTGVTIIIKVLDVNELPVCNDMQVTQDIMENEEKLLGQIIGKMDCNDGDAGSQKLVYNIVSDKAGYFDIDGRNIKLRSKPDREWRAKNESIENYENNGIYIITVNITDNGTPPRSLIRTEAIQIRDQPDENPIFSNKSLKFDNNRNSDQFIIIDPDENGKISHVEVPLGFSAIRVEGSTNRWYLTYSDSIMEYCEINITARGGTDGAENTNKFRIEIDGFTKECGVAPGEITGRMYLGIGAGVIVFSIILLICWLGGKSKQQENLFDGIRLPDPETTNRSEPLLANSDRQISRINNP